MYNIGREKGGGGISGHYLYSSGFEKGGKSKGCFFRAKCKLLLQLSSMQSSLQLFF